MKWLFLELSDSWLLIKETRVLTEIVSSSHLLWIESRTWAPAPSCPVGKLLPHQLLCPGAHWPVNPVWHRWPWLCCSYGRLCHCSALWPAMCALSFTLGISALKNSESIISCSDFQRTDVIGKNPFQSLGLEWIVVIKRGQFIITNPLLKVFFGNLSRKSPSPPLAPAFIFPATSTLLVWNT